MVFGVVGLEGSETSNSETKKNSLGSGFLKHHGSGSIQDEWRSSKMAKNDTLSSSESMPFHQGIPLLRSNRLETCQKELMLSFSSTSEAFSQTNNGGVVGKAPVHQSLLPCFQLNPPSFSKIAGYGNNNRRTHASINDVKGPFTPLQWIELEHQALIYKCITSNVAVPSNLLTPLKKSLYPFALSDSSVGSISPNSTGWDSFHLGFSNNTDPEPGRCRRTDGKKWRCSRDAVPDQKYCERHINRGRHRSRKPVEGQTGHNQTGITNSKLLPVTSTSNGTGSGLGNLPHQFKGLQSCRSSYDSANGNGSRLLKNQHCLSSMAIANLGSYEGRDLRIKQEIVSQESAQSGYGLVSTDSKTYGSFLNFNTQDQHSLYQLIGQYTKDYRGSSPVVTWPEEMKSDWTQLFMSSSSCSPAQEKHTLSALQLAHEIEPDQLSQNHSKHTERQASRALVGWETLIGGPLGEVLKNSGSSLKAWDGSPRFGSSPTGILQKATLCSLSNSSSGSCNRTESRILDGATTLFEDVFGYTFGSSSVPSLAPGSDYSL